MEGARMNGVVGLWRGFMHWRFRARGLATIADVGQEAFERVLLDLEAERWSVVGRYAGIDAGIDYDCVRLKRHGICLKCEWDPWEEWSIEGPAALLREMADRFKLVSRARWRWAGVAQDHVPTLGPM
jgi:hypothetical protein